MPARNKVETASAATLINISKRLLITGIGGCGKSTLIKHLFLDTAKNLSYIPIYFELRNLSAERMGLIDAIYERICNLGFSLEKEYFVKALELGQFAFFLDGYDEVAPALRDSVSKEIHNLSERYRDCVLIVTSRPDDSFVSWNLFTVLKTLPLDKSQACELIKRLNYEHNVKERFLKELDGKLFERHNSFLSNPLLLTIMLMTYSQFAEIPSKIHVFYSQAFETLFSRHDAQKGAYKRETESKLSIDDFRKVVACLSLLSYFDKRISFSKDEVRVYLEQSKTITQIDYDVENVIADLLNSVCLLREDGLDISFTHRSFQEYFSAYFISQSSQKSKLLRKLHQDIRFAMDSVGAILFELDRDLVESEFVLSNLQKISKLTNYDSTRPEESFFEYCKQTHMEITLYEGSGETRYRDLADSPFFFDSISRFYGDYKREKGWEAEDVKAFIQKYANVTNDKGQRGVYIKRGDDDLLLKYASMRTGLRKEYLYWMHKLIEIETRYKTRQDSVLNLLLEKGK